MRVTISGKIILEEGEEVPVVTPQIVRDALRDYDMTQVDLARTLGHAPSYADNIKTFLAHPEKMTTTFKVKFHIWLNDNPQIVRAWEPVPVVIHRDRLAGDVYTAICDECAARLRERRPLTAKHITYRVGGRQTATFLTTNVERHTCCAECRSAWKVRTRKKK